MKKILLVLCCLLALVPLSSEGGKVALVLSGGGARGFSELAVMEAMESYGIPVDMVLGTSMGALIGSLYSCGYSPKEITQYVKTHDLMGILLQPVNEDPYNLPDAFRMRDDNIFAVGFSSNGGVGSAPGLLGDQKMLEMMDELYGKAGGITDFDEFPIPFRAVATDAITGKRIVYDHGSLMTAVRSSISLPLVFSPYPQENGSLAMDGGMSDNIPIKLAKDLGADFVVAVDVNADQRLKPSELNTLTDAALQSLVIVTQTNSVPQYALADILVTPDVGAIGTLAFDRFDELVDLGRQACERHGADFTALAKKVEASGRTLKVLDPDRESSYDNLPVRSIRSVEVVDRSATKHDIQLSKHDFDGFLGTVLDEETREKLVAYLERIKISHQLASVSYEVRNNNDGKTVDMSINYTAYAVPQYWFSIGGNSSMGLSNNTKESVGWGLFDAKETISLSGLTKKGLDMKIWLFQGQNNGLGVSLAVPFFNKKSHLLGLDTAFTFQTGSLMVDSNLVRGNRVAPRDVGARFSLSGIYKYGSYMGLRLSFLLDWVYAWVPNSNSFIPSFSLSGVFDTMHEKSLCQNGIRAHFEGKIGWTEKSEVVGSTKLRYRQDFVLKKDAQLVGFEAQYIWMRLPDGQNGSYYDVGGLEGMPGYSLSSLREDYCSLAFRWRCRIAKISERSLFLEERVQMALMNTEDPFDAEYASSPFKNRVFDLGLMQTVAITTPVGNFGIGFGMSIRGKFSLVLGVLE
jgi:NTE family protein